MHAKHFVRTFEFALIILSLIPGPFLVMAETTKPHTAVKARAASRTTNSTQAAEATEPPVVSSVGESAPAAANTAAPVGNTLPTSGTVSGSDISSYYGKKFMNGPSSSNKIAITFDDGPSAKLTPQVLVILKREGIKATFFMLGEEVKQSPELARRVAAEGHEIGCHTTSHCNLRTKSPARIQKEVVGAARDIEQVTGKKPHVFRPPYGEYNKSVQQSCAEGEMVMVLWSVDTNDWRKRSSPESIYATCLRETQGGSVILMHDIHEKGIQALPRVIKDLKVKGFQFVTLSDLVAETIKHSTTPAAGATAGHPGTEAGSPVRSKPASKSRSSRHRK